MEARAVWEAQENLAAAEQDLREMAADEATAQRSGAWVSSGDYLRSPAGRAVEALRTQVQAMQAEVGGTVYRIPAENTAGLVAKLTKLQKRAEKKDLGSLTFRLTDEVERHESRIDPLVAQAELGYIPKPVTIHRFLILDAETLKLADWMLLATLTVEPGGVMISKVPGYARAWDLHREGHGDAPEITDGRFGGEVADAAQTKLDELDLGAYRDEAKATQCDYCGKPRKRTRTFLVEHAETGEVKQVGSNCLRDFLGTDPARLVHYASFLSDIEDAMEEGRGGGGSGREFLTEEYLTHVCALIRTEGWVARSSYDGQPTANKAYSNILDYGKVEAGWPQYTPITDEDHQRAVAAIEWATTTLAETARSDFDHNLVVAARGLTVPKKGDGILAYLPVAHAKALEREIEYKVRETQRIETEGSSEHVGQVKDRIGERQVHGQGSSP